MTCLRSEMGLGGFVLRDLLTRVSFWGQWIHPPITLYFNLWNLFQQVFARGLTSLLRGNTQTLMTVFIITFSVFVWVSGEEE